MLRSLMATRGFWPLNAVTGVFSDQGDQTPPTDIDQGARPKNQVSMMMPGSVATEYISHHRDTWCCPETWGDVTRSRLTDLASALFCVLGALDRSLEWDPTPFCGCFLLRGRLSCSALGFFREGFGLQRFAALRIARESYPSDASPARYPAFDLWLPGSTEPVEFGSGRRKHRHHTRCSRAAGAPTAARDL